MGLPWRGRKRTVVGVLQSAQTVECRWVRLVGRGRVGKDSKGIYIRVQEYEVQRNDSVTHVLQTVAKYPVYHIRFSRISADKFTTEVQHFIKM